MPCIRPCFLETNVDLQGILEEQNRLYNNPKTITSNLRLETDIFIIKWRSWLSLGSDFNELDKSRLDLGSDYNEMN